MKGLENVQFIVLWLTQYSVIDQQLIYTYGIWGL